MGRTTLYFILFAGKTILTFQNSCFVLWLSIGEKSPFLFLSNSRLFLAF